MKSYAVITLVLALGGCATYPNGEPIYWGNINQAVQDMNRSQPKRTYCTTVEDQTLCETR
jgi:hypothetical protein